MSLIQAVCPLSSQGLEGRVFLPSPHSLSWELLPVVSVLPNPFQWKKKIHDIVLNLLHVNPFVFLTGMW